RRLAPETYLGVIGLKNRGNTYRPTTEDDPEAMEFAVHMRRLPADRIMTSLLDRDALTIEMVDALAARLVSFHQNARGDPAVAAHGAPSVIERIIGDSFASAGRFRGQSISPTDDDAIQSFCRGFVERRRQLLQRRIAAGRIRECHGDLHAEHICFCDPLVIFDCVEFSEPLRCCDMASEIAFLAMDLAFHRRRDLADRLVSHYAELAGDPELPALVPFYACHRAYIRGLVDGLAAREPEISESDRAKLDESARRHFLLAYRYTWAYRR